MKSTIRSAFILAVICICIFSILGCSSAISGNGKDLQKKLAAIEKSETYPEAPGQLAVVYGSLSDLVSDADLIVKGKAEDSSVVLLNELPQTHTQLCVEEVLKGEYQIGAVIEVIEEGGDGKQVMGGIPCMADGTEYYLFLNKDGDNYYICGAFQGRFIVRDGFVFQQATADVKLSSYSPLTEAEFKDLIVK